MVDEVITKQELIDAQKDARNLGKAVNEFGVVNPRYGESYPTLPSAIKIVLETGGFEPFETEAELLASVPTIEKKASYALDTHKIFLWESGAWKDTGLSSIDQAKDFSVNLTKNYVDDRLENLSVSKHGNVDNLLEVADSNSNSVVIIDGDGDILNPNHSFNEVGNKAKSAHEDLSVAKNKGLHEKLDTVMINADEEPVELSDANGSKFIQFTQDGDMLFGGGSSLKMLTRDEHKSHFTAKEFIDESFNQAILSGLAFNRAKTSYLFDGAFKQKFRIKNEADFLGLKISQGVAIDLDTPYLNKQVDPVHSSQVVHPYICTFKNYVHGFKHILLANPFHNTNDLYENPCVWGSNDLNNFVLLDKFDQPLSEFLPTGVRNYNSDNAAIFDHTTGEYVVLFRNSESQALGLYNRHYLLRTSDFINFSSPIKMLKEDGSDLSGSTLNLSPTVLFNPSLNKWMMYQVEWDGAAQGFSYRTSDHLEYGWSQPLPILTNPNMQSWHCEVRYCGQHFIAIVADINSQTNASNGFGDLFIGISLDGVNFAWSNSIFEGAFNNPYKATITHEVIGNAVKFHILWTSNGNDFAGWRLYHSETNLIEVE